MPFIVGCGNRLLHTSENRVVHRVLLGPAGAAFTEVPQAKRAAGQRAGAGAAPGADPATARSLPTGDERFPWLALSAEAARLFDRQSSSFRPLALPVPHQDVTSALVVEGKLLLGTAGYGILGTRCD